MFLLVPAYLHGPGQWATKRLLLLLLYLGAEPLLLFANRHDVRLMSLYTHDYREVKTRLHSAVAVDYDYRGRKIFWSDVGSEKIFWCVGLLNCIMC